MKIFKRIYSRFVIVWKWLCQCPVTYESAARNVVQPFLGYANEDCVLNASNYAGYVFYGFITVAFCGFPMVLLCCMYYTSFLIPLSGFVAPSRCPPCTFRQFLHNNKYSRNEASISKCDHTYYYAVFSSFSRFDCVSCSHGATMITVHTSDEILQGASRWWYCSTRYRNHRKNLFIFEHCRNNVMKALL